MSATRQLRPRDVGPEPGLWNATLAALFLAALAWKLACLVRLARSPLFGELSSDSAAYWGWAQFLAREGWLGHNAFFLGPLYPYLLALFHPAPSSSLLGPLLAQCVLGSAACVLLATAARRVCAWPYALCVGMLAAGNSMANLLDLSVLSESLLWFLGALFLWLQLAVTRSAAPRGHAIWSGLIIGVMTLARPSFGLFLIPVAVAAGARGGPRAAVRAVLVSSLAVLACCLPVLARHAVLGYGVIPTTYSLGYNAYVGNGPGATGGYKSPADEWIVEPSSISEMEGGAPGDGREFIAQSTGLRLSPAASSAWWLRATWSAAVASPGRTLGLWVRKAALSLNHVEASQLEDLEVHERILGPLGIPWLGSFGVVGTLGLIGLVLIRRRDQGRILLAHAASAWFPLLAFFVTDRYRHHFTLPLLVACGPVFEATVRAVRHARLEPQRVARLAGPAMIAGVIVWLPLTPGGRGRVEFLSRWTLAEARLRHGDRIEAECELRSALAPDVLARLPLARSSTAREAVANAMRELGDSYAQHGRFEESDRWLVCALKLTPASPSIQRDHAVMMALTGHGSRALCAMRRLGFDPKALVDELNADARSAAERQDLERSEVVLRSSLGVDSTQELANVVLLRLLATQGRIEEAHRLLELLPERGLASDVVARERLSLGLGSGASGQTHEFAAHAASNR